MASFPLPPWLSPPDIISAAARGASIGAELRGQDIQQASAADRLRSAYDQLALKEQYANERAADRQALMSQGLEIRRQALENQAQRNADLAQYQQGLLSERGKSDEARAKSAAELLGLRQQGLDLSTQRLQDAEKNATALQALREAAAKRPRFHSAGGVLYKEGADGSLIPMTQPSARHDLTDKEKVLMGMDVKEMKSIDDQLSSLTPSSGLFGIGSNREKIQALQDKKEELRKRIEGYGSNPNEAIMYHGNRPVVVDPTTKKVLRYADEPADMGTTDGSTDESD